MTRPTTLAYGGSFRSVNGLSCWRPDPSLCDFFSWVREQTRPDLFRVFISGMTVEDACKRVGNKAYSDFAGELAKLAHPLNLSLCMGTVGIFCSSSTRCPIHRPTSVVILASVY